ncbi:hypothetical protein BD310DRAFT_1026821, partial [Dichomitus squalens]
SELCHAIVTITCPCSRIHQPILCGRSPSNSGGRESSQQLKCSNECAIAEHNALLAEALGIHLDCDDRTNQVTYSDGLASFVRANTKSARSSKRASQTASRRTRRARCCHVCPSKSASSCTTLQPCTGWTPRRWTRNRTGACSPSGVLTQACPFRS